MTNAPRSFDKMQELVDAVQRSGDPQGALAVVVDALLADHTLWGAWILEHITEQPERAVVRAAWSMTETVLDAGLEIALDLTQEVRQVAETLLLGRPKVIRPTEFDLGLLGDMATRQGTRVLMAIPLERDGVVRSVMLLGSASSEGFTAEDVPFFTGLGKGIEDHINGLLVAA